MLEISLRKEKEDRIGNLGAVRPPPPPVKPPSKKFLQRRHIGNTDVVSEVPRNSSILDRELLSVLPPMCR
jgi:hypothetical protein